jgi:hypothetical protein
MDGDCSDAKAKEIAGDLDENKTQAAEALLTACVSELAYPQHPKHWWSDPSEEKVEAGMTAFERLVLNYKHSNVGTIVTFNGHGVWSLSK